MFFKNLKWQLLASSIAAVILIACLIAFAANKLIVPAIIIAIIIAAYIILVNIWFDHYISKPIEDLSESARHIADGSYGAQVQSVGDNEIGRLTDDINIMSEKIARSDKATAEFISQISHELRTPLTAILGWSETLQYDPAIKDESLRGVKIISKEAERLTGIRRAVNTRASIPACAGHLRIMGNDTHRVLPFAQIERQLARQIQVAVIALDHQLIIAVHFALAIDRF